jgi:hypothetical protein
MELCKKMRSLKPTFTLKPFAAGSVITGLFILMGCSQISFQPEASIQQDLTAFCSPQQRQADNLQLVGSRDWANGKIILYEGACRSNTPGVSPLQVRGYKVFLRQGWGWQASSGGSSASDPNQQPSPQKLVDYTAGQVEGNRLGDRYAVVEGQVLNYQVAAVETRFNTGEVLRDKTTDGRFALVAAEADRVCEVRVLGVKGQLLQQERLTPAEQAHTAAGTCR